MAAEGLEDVLDDGIEILEESVEDKETASRRNEQDQRTTNFNYFSKCVY